MSLDTPAALAQAMDDARRCLEQGRWPEAEVICRRILSQGDHSDVFQWLGRAAYQTGQYELAVQSCARAVELNARARANQLTLGRSLLALGRGAEAVEAFKEALELEPTNSVAAMALLETALAVQGFATAEKLYAAAAGSIEDPAFAATWRALAFAHGHVLADAPPRVMACRQMTVRDWAVANHQWVLDLGEAEPVPVAYPPEDPGGPFQAVIAANPPYVAELKDVRIFSKSHIVLTPDGMALNDTGAHPRYGRYVSHVADQAVAGQSGEVLVLDLSPFEMEPLEAGVMLCGPASQEFGHWAAEYLPRLEFLECHPRFAELPIIIDEGMPQSHLDHLAAMVSNPLVVLRAGHGLRCRRLVYAPTPTFFPIHLLPNPLEPYVACAVAPRSYRFIKARVEARLGARPPGRGRYYLSRRRSGWRRIANDEEVSAFLEARGFQTVLVETLTFEQQVRLFQDAACIVAGNGSALQNIVFADTGVRLVVLTAANLHNLAAFYGQMIDLGYRPQFVRGEAVGDPRAKHNDYVIPLDALAAALPDKAASKEGWRALAGRLGLRRR